MSAPTSVTVQDLHAAIEAGRAPAILDVRSAQEYAAGHVPGADHLPFWAVPLGAAKITAVREEPLVVYCGHGPRAWMAGAALRRHGFRDIRYLKGHWAAWKRAALPAAR